MLESYSEKSITKQGCHNNIDCSRIKKELDWSILSEETKKKKTT